MGPFELGEQLGAGGMGVVYRAVYTENGKQVALKVLSPAVNGNPGLVSRFEREMAILKRLRHPNIVQYFGGGKSGGQHFYAMEYVTGGSVEDRLKRTGPLPWEEALDVLRQLAAALEHSHDAGVIHRDLKPANLFYAGSGRVKLGDFGIARDTEATALTAAGKTVGTYAYMAPEQIAGKPPVSRRTDLYALGCVAFELMTGRPPFIAENPPAMLFAHLNDPPPKVRDFEITVPIWVERFVDKLLAKNPDDRYYDALAVQVALDEIKEKVAAGQSMAAVAAAGGAPTLASGDAARAVTEGKEIRDLLAGKKKKKKRKGGPIYEQVWFLALCLLLVAGGITWAMWPPGEADLLAAADAVWVPGKPDESREARAPLETLLARFPDGPHAADARGRLDALDQELIDSQVGHRLRFDQEPRDEAEKLYMAGRRAETGDRIVAVGKYRSLIKLLADRPDARHYVALAERRAADLEGRIGRDGTTRFVEEELLKADRKYEAGRIGEARDIWNSVVALYGGRSDLAPHVRYAQARLDGQEPPPLDLSRAAGTELEDTGPPEP